MNKHIKSICRNKYYGIITSVSAGLFIIVSLVAVLGAGLTFADIPEPAVTVLNGFILVSGGFVSGRFIGKNKRKRGIVNGLKSGIALWSIIFLFGVVYMRDVSLWVSFKNMLLICIPSVTGSVSGVNSKIKRPPV